MEEINNRRSIQHIQGIVRDVMSQHIFEPYDQITIESIQRGIEMHLTMLEMSEIIVNSIVEAKYDISDPSSLHFIVRYQPAHTEREVGFSARYSTPEEVEQNENIAAYDRAMKVVI